MLLLPTPPPAHLVSLQHVFSLKPSYLFFGTLRAQASHDCTRAAAVYPSGSLRPAHFFSEKSNNNKQDLPLPGAQDLQVREEGGQRAPRRGGASESDQSEFTGAPASLGLTPPPRSLVGRESRDAHPRGLESLGVPGAGGTATRVPRLPSGLRPSLARTAGLLRV